MQGNCYVHRCEVREATFDDGRTVHYAQVQLALLDAKGDAGEIVNLTGAADLAWGGRGDYEVTLRFTARDGKTQVRVASMEKIEPF